MRVCFLGGLALVKGQVDGFHQVGGAQPSNPNNVFGQQSNAPQDTISAVNEEQARVTRCNDDDGNMIILAQIVNPRTQLSGEDGWETLDNVAFEKKVELLELVRGYEDLEGQRYLTLSYTFESDECSQTQRIGGYDLCTKNGVNYDFKCYYSLADQTLEQDMVIKGQLEPEEAANQGNIPYDFVVSSNHRMGEKIDFSIQPRHEGLLFATVRNCKVRQTRNEENSVTIFGVSVDSCYLADLSGGWVGGIASSDGDINGYFDAFRWATQSAESTSEVDEQQHISCTIALSEEVNDTPVTECYGNSNN